MTGTTINVSTTTVKIVQLNSVDASAPRNVQVWGNKDGLGKYSRPGGEYTLGEWFAGAAHGRGMHVYADGTCYVGQVLWLGTLLPRLLTTPNGSQRLPTAPYDYKHTLLSAPNDSH